MRDRVGISTAAPRDLTAAGPSPDRPPLPHTPPAAAVEMRRPRSSSVKRGALARRPTAAPLIQSLVAADRAEAGGRRRGRPTAAEHA